MRKILFFLALAYTLCYVWPGRWRYDHLGATPIRTERVTGRMQFCNFHGWQWQLQSIGDNDAPLKIKPADAPPTPSPVPTETPVPDPAGPTQHFSPAPRDGADNPARISVHPAPKRG